MKECIMNKKFIFTLLLLINQHTHLNAQPAMGLEMTFPLGALLFVLPGGECSYVQGRISKAGWGSSPYWKSLSMSWETVFTVGLPQVDGYFATTDLFDFCLQAGVNQQYGFKTPNGTYGSPIFYFSDIMRLQRNKGVKGSMSWWDSFENSSCVKGVSCPKSPSSSVTRGMKSTGWGQTVDDALKISIINNIAGMQHMKYYGFTSAKSLTIDTDSFTAVGGQTRQFYFAQTGVGIYLPLHMISPGSNLLAAEPDYLNFGPAPGTPAYNTPQPGTILPWTHGYMPHNIPANFTGNSQTTDVDF